MLRRSFCVDNSASNLLGNAAKYSQYARPARVQVEGWLDEGHVFYSVRDNGLGIAAKDLPRIFELFNRMENVKDIEGSGVGLAIVKRIVEKHKGNIWAESEIGNRLCILCAVQALERSALLELCFHTKGCMWHCH